VSGLLGHLGERQRQVGAHVEQGPAWAPGVRRVPVVLIHAEDRDDVRVFDPGHRPGLGDERARLGLAVHPAR
jgi:hypothetical protein